MENSKKFLKDNQIIPRISFKDGLAHTVKLVADKEDSLKDPNTGEIVTGMKYLVEEGGEQKTFFTSSIALVQKLSAYNIGDEVTIKMVSKKVDGQFKSSFVVSKKGEEVAENEDLTDEESAPAVPNF